MSISRTINFLPEYLQSKISSRFISATLDRLVSSPIIERFNGLIGEQYVNGQFKGNDFILENTPVRQNYQLESNFVVSDSNQNITESIGFLDVLNSVADNNGNIDNWNRLLTSNSQSWKGFINLDKLINYSNYAWVPQDSSESSWYWDNPIVVSNNQIPLSQTFTFSKPNNGFLVENLNGTNPAINLLRGGNYTFTIPDGTFSNGNIWIQTDPGVLGLQAGSSVISSRNIEGITNNGISNGSITFNVPSIQSNQVYLDLQFYGNENDNVNLGTTLDYDQINGASYTSFISQYGGIDGVTNLDGQTLIFVNNQTTGWGAVPNNEWFGVWEISVIAGIINLTYSRDWLFNYRITVTGGYSYRGSLWYKNSSSTITKVPYLESLNSTLYIQNDANPEEVLQLNIIAQQNLPGYPLLLPVTLASNVNLPLNGLPNVDGINLTTGDRILLFAQNNPVENGIYDVSAGAWTRASDLSTNFQIQSAFIVQVLSGYTYGNIYFSHGPANLAIIGQTKISIIPVINSSILDVENQILNKEHYTSGNNIEFTNGLLITFAAGTISNVYGDTTKNWIVEGVGKSIALVPVDTLTVPKEILLQNNPQDYITINRASLDQNPWSRTNQWFHIDTLTAMIQYASMQNSAYIPPSSFNKAIRPIIEFYSGLKLFNFGNIALPACTLVDRFTTSAFDNVQGKSSYTIDGVDLVEGMTVIFNADKLSTVRQNIYLVNFIVDNNGNNVISLEIAETAIENNCVWISSGTANNNNTLVWDNTTNYWYTSSQVKSTPNVSPLFDMFDINGNSYSNISIYNESTFAGSKLFSYSIGNGIIDPVLGFPLSYGNIGNLDDILFTNNYAVDSFFYQPVTTSLITNSNISSAFALRMYNDNSSSLFTPWEYINSNLELYQNLVVIGQSNITVTGNLLTKTQGLTFPHKVYIDGIQLPLNQFSVTQNGNSIQITINSNLLTASSRVFIKLLATTPIENAYYDVPSSYESNPFGQYIESFTITSLKNHIASATSNLTSIISQDVLEINLDDNYFKGVSGSIIFQESLSVLPALLLTNKDYNILDSIRIAANDYNLYKQKFLNIATQIFNIQNLPTKQAVDQIIQQLVAVTDSTMPWYTSDMFGVGGTINNISIINRNQNSFVLQNIYNWNIANTKSLLVYKNNVQLYIGFDYTTSSSQPLLTLTVTPNIGDIISIYEIADTNGSMMPATPTKLGLAKLFKPSIYTDNSYETPRVVIQGHDGSITTAFNDYRDQLLLDLEMRIFNNIKVDNQFWSDVIALRNPLSGAFRQAQSSENFEIQPYSTVEQTEIMQQMFYEWVSQYQIDYSQSFYNDTNLFTWNWNQSSDNFNNQLNGYWRAIYNNYYDTTSPDITPWELLNISIKPTWWDTTYGAAPYTGQNLLMWSDIANGIIRNPAGITYTSSRIFNNISLLNMIPVNENGVLLNPGETGIINNFNNSGLNASFVFGDGGPVETAWRRSSYYAFAQLRLQILKNPTFMCGSLWDLNNYQPDNTGNNFKYNKQNLGQLSDVVLNSVDTNLNGTSVSVNSILNYSIEYLRKQGKNTNLLRTSLNNVVTNLVYNLAGFADLSNLAIYANQNDPNEEGSKVQLPQEDYTLFLSQNLPSGQISYSGVIITVTDGGYKVSGYDKYNPFFIIYKNISSSQSNNLTVGNSTFKVYKTYEDNTTIVPYNTIFANRQLVINFLMGYGEYLKSIGICFDINLSLGQIGWQDAANQFVQWSYENWSIDPITGQSLALVLNPAASQLVITLPSGTLQDLTDTTKNILIDVNKQIIDQKYLDVYRDGNTITITHQAGGVIAGLRANIVSFEHKLIINNTTIFNDLINDPLSGIRQSSLQIIGQKTGNWDGTINTPGFMIALGYIDPWVANQDYLAGSLVVFKNSNYVAISDVIGSENFQYNQFTLITTTFSNSVLPNLSVKADDLSHAYDVNYETYITDISNLRNSTLGYVEKNWLSNLGIDITSQSSFYRGWLKGKGTLAATTNFGRASNEIFNTATTINEEFAVNVSNYGAMNNTGYCEVLLQQEIINQNPLVVEFTDTPTPGNTYIIQVPTYSLYKHSNNWNTNFIQLPGSIKTLDKPMVLAGPAIPDTLISINQQRIIGFKKTDIDLVSFERITDLVNNINQESILNIAINSGLFWINQNYLNSGVNKWDIIKFVPTSAIISSYSQTDLNLVLTISTDINLLIGNLLAVNYIDPSTNSNISGIFSIIDYIVNPTDTAMATITLQGTTQAAIGSIYYSSPLINTQIYKAESLRFNSIAEINSTIDENIFVDYDNLGWAYYSQQTPFSYSTTVVPSLGISQPTGVAYDENNKLLWVAVPTANNNQGELVIKYVANYSTSLGVEQPSINVNTGTIVSARGDSETLGYNVKSLNNSRVIASAKDNIYNYGQVYVAAYSPNELPGFGQVEQILSIRLDQIGVLGNIAPNFGSSITSSEDGQWIYIGSPNTSNQYQVQIFNLQNAIFCSYTTNLTSNTICELTGAVTPNSAYSLRVIYTSKQNNILDWLLIPDLEYTLNGNNIIFSAPLDSDAVITVEQIDTYYQWVGAISSSQHLGELFGDLPLTYSPNLGIIPNQNFGSSLSTNNNGSKLIVGAPGNSTGSIYVFDRIIENSYYPNGTTIVPISTPVYSGDNLQVLVNQIIIPKVSYSYENQQITFGSALPSQSLVNIYINNFELTQILSENIAQFGSSVALNNNVLVVGASAAIGSSQTDLTVNNQGAAFVFALDSQISSNKTIPINQFVLMPGDIYRINNWAITVENNLVSSFIDQVNNLSNYTGISASLNNSTNDVIFVNSPLSMVNGILVSNFTNGAALQSNFNIIQTLNDSTKYSLNFGNNIKWLSNSMFAIESNYLEGYNPNNLLEINDGTIFDSTQTDFYNGNPGFSQFLTIYQLLTTDRNWVNSTVDIIQAVAVKSIEIAGSQGTLIYYDGTLTNLWVGNSLSGTNTFLLYNNLPLYQGWTLTQFKDAPIEPRSISSAWIYNPSTNTKLVDIELVDLAKGILPTSVKDEFAYISDIDPASYNYSSWIPWNNYNLGDIVQFNNQLWTATVNIIGTNYFNTTQWSPFNPTHSFINNGQGLWGDSQVGQTWFRTRFLKVIDAKLGNLSQRATYWNTFFPTANIQVFEWVSSPVPPSAFISTNENGYLENIEQPFVYSKQTGLYYFWVYNKTTLTGNNSISSGSLATIIGNINNSGIPLISAISTNAVALWNINQYVLPTNSVLHIDYVIESSNNQLHSEFVLISNDGTKSWLTTPLYNKFIDSLCGVTTTNLLVPSQNISESQQYGTGINPEQSIFVNREEALLIYYTSINTALMLSPIASSTILSFLQNINTLPTVGFNISVPDYTTLMSIDTTNLPENYTVLVVNNSNILNNGWNVVALSSTKKWVNVNNQTIDLSMMYTLQDWVSNGYVITQPTYTIGSIGDLPSITPITNDTIGVLNNGNNNYAVYQVDSNNNLIPVYIENGTIQFTPQLFNFNTANIGFDEQPYDQIRYFDDDPYIAIRMITNSLNSNILIGDLSYIADDAFFAVIRYIIYENKNLDWLFKTSFVSVDYLTSNLNVQSTYRADNPSLVQDFLAETLPYHTRIREFRSIYESMDQGNLLTTDFDLPAQYDTLYANYILNQTNNPPVSLVRSPDGTLNTDATTLQLPVYSEWNNNHTYSIENIEVVYGGANNVTTPVVTLFGGGGGSGWTGTAVVDPLTKSVVAVNTTKIGTGYTSTPTVIFYSSSNETISAIAVAVLNNKTVRDINTTIRFDRVGYTTEPYTGNIELSTAINRISAYYAPTDDMLANRPKLLMTGLDNIDSVVTNGNYASTYIVPTGPLSYQDDPLLSQTQLMLTFDPALISNTIFSNQIVKFGQQSGSFDQATNRYMIIDTSKTTELSELNLSTVDFTIEFFFRFNSLEADTVDNNNTILSIPIAMTMFDTRNIVNGNIGSSGITIGKTIDNNLTINFYDYTTGNIITPTITDGGIDINVWQYIVLERINNTFVVWLDGNKICDYTATNILDFNNQNLTFGADAAGNNGMNGYIDSCRITANIGRYDILNQTIDIPYESFPTSLNEDPYFSAAYTKLLYNFASFNNEASPNIIFKSVNSSNIINDISNNSKILQIYGYNNEVVINNSLLNNTNAGTILCGSFTGGNTSGYLSASTDPGYNFGVDDFAVELWVTSLEPAVTQTIFEITDAQSQSDIARWRNRFMLTVENNILSAVILRSRWGMVVTTPANIISPVNSLDNMRLFYNGMLLSPSDYKIVNKNLEFTFNVVTNDIIELSEILTTCSANSFTNNTAHFISIERKDNILYLFVDGILQSFSNASANIPNTREYWVADNAELQIAPAALFIGANRNGVNNFIGLIGDIRITNGVSRYACIAQSLDDISLSYLDTIGPLNANISNGSYEYPVNAPEELMPLSVYEACDIQVYENINNITTALYFKDTVTGNIFELSVTDGGLTYTPSIYNGNITPILITDSVTGNIWEITILDAALTLTETTGPAPSIYSFKDISSSYIYNLSINDGSLELTFVSRSSNNIGFSIYKSSLGQGVPTNFSISNVSGNTFNVPWITQTADSVCVTVGNILLASDEFTINNSQLQLSNVITNGNINVELTGKVELYCLAAAAITTLSANLYATDSTIYLENTSNISTPNPSYGILGKIIINGEIITFLTIDRINNSISGIRRGVLGSGIGNIYTVGTPVFNAQNSYKLPESARTKVWTTPGNGTPSNGQGLANGDTATAIFLVESSTILPN